MQVKGPLLLRYSKKGGPGLCRVGWWQSGSRNGLGLCRVSLWQSGPRDGLGLDYGRTSGERLEG